jgi:hypothetical protein
MGDVFVAGFTELTCVCILRNQVRAFNRCDISSGVMLLKRTNQGRD